MDYATRTSIIIALCITAGGCASIPTVELPNPSILDNEGQVQHFTGITPQQILIAAETVLRKHQPEGKIIHEKDMVIMDYKGRFFYGFWAGYEIEHWAIVARQDGEVTVASVAMGKATDGYFLGLATTSKEYPQPGVHIDYSSFWKRINSLLKGQPFPECENRKAEKIFDPLCMLVEGVAK